MTPNITSPHLQQHHLGGLRDADVEALHVLCLPHQLHDLLVKVDQDAAGLRVLDKQGGSKPSLALVDVADPGLNTRDVVTRHPLARYAE